MKNDSSTVGKAGSTNSEKTLSRSKPQVGISMVGLVLVLLAVEAQLRDCERSRQSIQAVRGSGTHAAGAEVRRTGCGGTDGEG